MKENEKIISLAKQLIQIRSVAGNAPALGHILDLAVKRANGRRVERFTEDGVRSALIYNTVKRPKRFRLLFNAHLDVVNYKDRQFVPRVSGKRLYGAGALDMKASAACVIAAFDAAARTLPYPVALQLTTDEETGGFHGTRHQVAKGVRADLVIAGEPTDLAIVNRTKGVLLVELTAKGVSAHGAYPWRGENAIMKMAAFLRALQERFPSPRSASWTTTVNVAMIGTGNAAFNKVPDDCTASLDVRYVPGGAAAALAEIRRALPRGVAMRVVADEAPLDTPLGEDLRRLRAAARECAGHEIVMRGAQGTSDARHFSRVGCPGIEFGPKGGDIGGDNEWVDIPSLGAYYRVLLAFMRSLDGIDGH